MKITMIKNTNTLYIGVTRKYYAKPQDYPRKKPSLGESLVESHAYNLIRDSI